jgi:Ras-related protein Rab-1A
MAGVPVLKVVIAGDGNVGKTSLVRRYCEDRFEISRVTTIGVDFQTKTVELPSGTVKLSIWDLAGQERFEVVRAGFYRGSRAAALVYAVSDPASQANLPRWRDEVLSAVPNQRLLVIGNKIDLPRATDPAAARSFAEQVEAPYLETSALSGEGVPALFETLARLAAGQPLA